VALVLAALLGYGFARWTVAGPDAAADGHDDQAPEQARTGEDRLALTAAQLAASGIEVVAVGRGGGQENRLSGRVAPVNGAHATVAAVIGGRIARVLVAPGAHVRAGDVLVIVVSGQAATLRADADAAQAQAQAARQALRRDQALVAQGVVARQELEASQARSLAAEAASRAALAQLAAAGGPDAQGRVAITSPVAGVVGPVQLAPGDVVNAGEPVATVVDPQRSELLFTAPPLLAAQLRAGMRMEVEGPGGGFPARILGVASDLRQAQGVAVIRAQADGAPLPAVGTPVSGLVIAGAGPGLHTVPADALQSLDGRAVVFVAETGGFRVAPVLPGRRAGGRVEILQGLRGDERIAAANAFLLKAELAKGQAGHGH